MAWVGDPLRVVTRAASGMFSALGNTGVGRQMLGGILPGAVGIPPKRGTREFLEAYSRMPLLRAIVGRIAFSVASTQWTLSVVTGANGRARGDAQVKALQRLREPRLRRKALSQLRRTHELKDVETHPFYDVMEGGNPYQTGLQMRMVYAASMECVGEAFWMKERTGKQLTSIWPIPAYWVLSTPTPATREYRISFRGFQATVPDTEMLWFADPDPANPYWRGTGVAQSVADELETDEYAAKVTKQRFLNGARPDVLITSPDLSDPEVKRLEQDWLQQSQGFWRWFKPRFMNREVQVHEFDVDMRCHDAETEALTRRGWVRGLDLRPDDAVATWSEERQALEYQVPQQLHSYEHRGVMHHWTGARIDALLTPNHRLWVARFQAGQQVQPWHFEDSAHVVAAPSSKIRWREAGWYDGGQKQVVIPAVEWTGRGHCGRPPRTHSTLTFDVHDFARFLGYAVAEGGIRSFEVQLSQRGGPAAKEAIIQDISDAVSIFPPAHVRTQRVRFQACRCWGAVKCGQPHDEQTWTITHKGLATWLQTHVGGHGNTKRLPAEAFEWPVTAQVELLRALCRGDGWWQATRACFTSNSERLLDDVQRMCVQVGWSASKVKVHGGWRLNIRQKATRAVEKQNGSWAVAVPYAGPVWCVTVPNGTLFTRRNGRVVLSGNSGQFVQIRQHERDLVQQTWGIPPEILGIIENSNRATITAAEYLYAKLVLLPRLELMRSILQERLIPEWDDRLILDYASPVEADKEFSLRAATAAPWSLDVDEWRELGGRDPLPEDKGKVYFLPDGRFVEEYPVTTAEEIRLTRAMLLEAPPEYPVTTAEEIQQNKAAQQEMQQMTLAAAAAPPSVAPPGGLQSPPAPGAKPTPAPGVPSAEEKAVGAWLDHLSARNGTLTPTSTP